MDQKTARLIGSLSAASLETELQLFFRVLSGDQSFFIDDLFRELFPCQIAFHCIKCCLSESRTACRNTVDFTGNDSLDGFSLSVNRYNLNVLARLDACRLQGKYNAESHLVIMAVNDIEIPPVA